MSSRAWSKTDASGDRANHVGLDLDGRRRGCKGRELRIERPGNPVRALRGKGRSRVEQSKVARMVNVDQSMLHLREGPLERFLQRLRRSKIELRKLPAEGLEIVSGNY